MIPILFTVGGLKIYTFGVFLVLAFFWGLFLFWKNIRLTVYKEEEKFDSIFLSLAGSLLIGRLVYVILNFKDFGFNLLKFILINGYPGLSLYGVLIGGFLTLFLYFLIKKISFRETIDYYIAPIFLALGLGKLGSFFSGVEVGTKTSFFLSIQYHGVTGLRHLTPLYEAIIFFIGVFLAQKILFAIRKKIFEPGFVFFFFCWFFSLTYFIFEPLKEKHLFYKKMSLNQVASVILLLTFSFYFVYYFRKLLISRLLIIINNINLSQIKIKFHEKINRTKAKKTKDFIRKRREKDKKTDRRV